VSQPSRLHRVDLRGSFGWPTSPKVGDTNAGWSHDQAALAGRSASVNAFEGKTSVIGKGSQVHPSAEVSGGVRTGSGCRVGRGARIGARPACRTREDQ